MPAARAAPGVDEWPRGREHAHLGPGAAGLDPSQERDHTGGSGPDARGEAGHMAQEEARHRAPVQESPQAEGKGREEEAQVQPSREDVLMTSSCRSSAKRENNPPPKIGAAKKINRNCKFHF